MSTLWQYLWPVFGAGAIAGVIAGIIGFRPRGRRTATLATGVVSALALAALWHGPFGGADRLSVEIDRRLRLTLVYYEMTQVNAHLHHGPLTRRVLLAGPADEFQRRELVRLMEDIPGVSKATWAKGDRGGLPLIVEGLLASLLGFLFGAFVAYVVELRRRYNSQWNW